MKLRLITAAFFGALLCGSAQTLVIVTHGFGGANASWYQPGGDFHESLKMAAAEQGHTVEHFTWDQSKSFGFTLNEQRAAGLKLAQKIIDFCQGYVYNHNFWNNDKIIIVAHSYGGLVSYHASIALGNFLHQLDQEKQTQYTGFSGWFRKTWHSLVENWQVTQPRPVISKLFTLGTPHQETDILPHTVAVEKLYNIYSTEDYVAAGLAGKPLLPQKLKMHRTTACNVLLLGATNETVFGFGHSEIHHPLVASEIFCLSDYVDNTHPRDDKHSQIARHVVYTIEMPEKVTITAIAENGTTTYESLALMAGKLGTAIDWKKLRSCIPTQAVV